MTSSADAGGGDGSRASFVFSPIALTAARFQLGPRGRGQEEAEEQSPPRLRRGDGGEQREEQERAGSKFTASIFQPNQKVPAPEPNF